jgi:hypothetical protein
MPVLDDNAETTLCEGGEGVAGTPLLDGEDASAAEVDAAAVVGAGVAVALRLCVTLAAACERASEISFAAAEAVLPALCVLEELVPLPKMLAKPRPNAASIPTATNVISAEMRKAFLQVLGEICADCLGAGAEIAGAWLAPAGAGAGALPSLS